MKNIILLDWYYNPKELEERIAEWVDFYNNKRCRESLNNVILSDRYYGRKESILKKRQKIKKKTMALRGLEYRKSLQIKAVEAK